MGKELNQLREYLDSIHDYYFWAYSAYISSDFLNSIRKKSFYKSFYGLDKKAVLSNLSGYKDILEVLTFSMGDTALLEVYKLFDENSSGVQIFKILTFLEQNYKKLNIQSEEFMREKSWNKEIQKITFNDIKKLRNKVENVEKILNKMKTIRDKKIGHNDKEKDESILLVGLGEVSELMATFEEIVNDIDSKFFSHSYDYSILKTKLYGNFEQFFKKSLFFNKIMKDQRNGLEINLDVLMKNYFTEPR